LPQKNGKNLHINAKKPLTAVESRLKLQFVLVAERLDWILERLRIDHNLSVKAAVRKLGISPDTARRDFDRLAAQNLARRTHGGVVATPFSYDCAPYTSLRQRSGIRAEQKLRIARAAAELVQPGETIAVDAGSTTFQLARLLGEAPCTVLAYSLDISSAVLAHENVQLFMAGGLVRRETQSAVGEESVSMLRRFQANTAFIGANAMNEELDVMTPNRLEAAVKRTLMEISDRSILLADSSKIGRRALSSFARADDFALVITDNEMDPEAASRIRERGVKIIMV